MRNAIADVFDDYGILRQIKKLRSLLPTDKRQLLSALYDEVGITKLSLKGKSLNNYLQTSLAASLCSHQSRLTLT